MPTIQLKRGSLSGLPSLSAGEPAFVTDEHRLYVGSSGGNRLMSVLKKIDATIAPTVNDDAGDGFSVGSEWVDTTNDKGYICADSTVGAAVWQQFSGSGVLAGALLSANNLSDLANVGTARTNLGLGTLATQSGTFSGTSSGTNTGDQTITLTGDVTGSGTGSFATAIGANKVTDAMLRQSAGMSVPGRSANSTGNVADMTAASDGHALRRSGTTLGFGTLEAGAFADNTIAPTRIAATATSRVFGRRTAGAGAGEELTGTQVFDLVSSSTGAIPYRNSSNWTIIGIGSTPGSALRLNALNVPVWGSPVYSRVVLGSNFTGTGASGAFQATGMSITIPATGYYEIGFTVRTLMLDSAVGGYATVRLALNGTAITNTELQGSYSPSSEFVYDTIRDVYRASFTTGDVISVQFAAFYTGTPSAVRGVYSDASGRSSISYKAL